jgi:predicted nucleic acid-binding protein
VSLESLERELPPGDRVLLDSSAIIAYVDGSEPVSPLATDLIDGWVRVGRNPAVVSMVSVMELLVRPRRRSTWEYLHVMDFLAHHPNLTCQQIDLPVAQEAASLRAAFKLPTPDALVVATGIVAQVSRLVTNDARWTKRLQLVGSRYRVLCLDDYVT